MKIMKKLLCIVLTVMMLLPVIPAELAEAAAKTAAPAYNGKWTYYAVYNTIYKLNSETGKAKKVTEVKDASFVSDILPLNKVFIHSLSRNILHELIQNFSHIFVSIISYSSAVIMPFEYISFACAIADL